MGPARLALALFVVATSCASHEAAGPVIVSGPPRVLVLPFQVGGTLGAAGVFVARAGGGAMPEGLGAQVAGTLGTDLARRGVDVASTRIVGPAALQDAASAGRAAAQAGANLAVLGAVGRFVEREGNAWAAKVPASVSYQALLVRAADGVVVASDQFDYTQQPLNENLLALPKFLQGGGKWVTRDEMLDGALDDTAAKFAAAVR